MNCKHVREVGGVMCLEALYGEDARLLQYTCGRK